MVVKEGVGEIEYNIERRCTKEKRDIKDMANCVMLVVLVL